MSGTTATSPGFLSSTGSSSYELDLPPLPEGPISLSSAAHSHPTKLPLKPKPPVPSKPKIPLYGNVQTGSDNAQLNTILEVADRESSSSEDDNTDETPIYSNTGAKSVDDDVKDEQRQYTELRRSRKNKDNHYATPSHNSIISTELEFSTSHSPSASTTTTTSDKHQDEPTEHVTSYVRVSDEHTAAPSVVPSGKHSRSTRWNFRRTFSRRYMQMTKVGMGNSVSGAKKFFIVLFSIVIFLIIAAAGVIVAMISWTLLAGETTSLEKELGSYTTALRYCRIGRNWTTIEINSQSRPNESIVIVDSGVEAMTPPTVVQLTNLPISRTVNLSSKVNVEQVLLYVILRKDGSQQPINSSNNVDSSQVSSAPAPTPYINVALWTRSNSTDQTFRQYLAILNDVSTPQIISKTLWFPYGGTDHVLVASAELLDNSGSELEANTETLQLRVYLAGYC